MTTGYRRVERTIEEVINDYLSERPTIMFSNFAPNIEVAKSAIEANEIDEEHHRWRGDTIRDVVRKVAGKLYRNEDGGLRYEFCENPRYRRSLDNIYDAYRDEKGNPLLARSMAVENIVIDAAVAAEIPLDDEQRILDLVAEPSIWSALPKSQAHVEYTQQTAVREGWISEMTQGGSKPFSLRTGNLNSETYDTAGRKVQFSGSGGRRFVKDDQGFAGMGDEQVKAMYDQWSTQQRYNRMSPEELRKTVRQQGKERFEQKFNSDPTTGKPVTSPNAATVLVDPRNGRAITTRLGLIEYINSSNDALQKLVKPRGTTIRERALAVDALLNKKD